MSDKHEWTVADWRTLYDAVERVRALVYGRALVGADRPVWPSPELEREMISTADRIVEICPNGILGDASCHIRALLVRVRELESQR